MKPASNADEMSFADYGKRDFEVVDYQFYAFPQLPDIGFRGPPLSESVLASGNYFSVIGAAQSLGVYVPEPYPDLLSRRLGLSALNLSLGGVNPGLYAQQPFLLERINSGRFAILQVMTARNEPNERMQPMGISLVRDKVHGDVEIPEVVWQRVLDEERQRAPAYVAQNVASWREAYRDLLARITVPVILFFFSYRRDDETTDFEAADVMTFYGAFPQFIGIDEVKWLAGQCHGYAECRSKRNFGHELISRFTGKPVEINFADLHPSATERTQHNHYYPSPEMHQDAVAPLEQAIREKGLL